MKRDTLFYGFVFLLAVANGMIMNHKISLWEGPESMMVWKGLHHSLGTLPQEIAASIGYNNNGIDTFLLRLPSTLFAVFSLFIFWLVGKPILGKRLILNTFLFVSASLLIFNLAKVASGDLWAMMSQMMSFILLLRYLKQPKLQWQIAFYVAFALSIWIQPLNSLLFILLFASWLYLRHPNGRNLIKLFPWGVGLVVVGGLYLLNIVDFQQHTHVIGFNSIRFFSWNLVGVLPFVGFAIAGLWETYKRSNKGEEMGIINIGFFFAALLSHALVLQFLLAMLAGKQLTSYFDPKYPHKNAVRGGAVIHLIVAVLGLTYFMLWIFFQFKGPGFRAGLIVCGLYWMWSVIAVIGIYGMNENYVRLGTIISGVLFTSLFWLQLGPLMESRRDVPSRLLTEALKNAPDTETEVECIILPAEGKPFTNVAPYTKLVYANTMISNKVPTSQDLNAVSDNPKLLLYDNWQAGLPTTLLQDSTQHISGWNSSINPIRYGWKWLDVPK